MPEYPLEIQIKMGVARILSEFSFLIPDRYFLVNFRGGKIYLNLAESKMMIQRALGVYEYWKTQLLENLVREGMVVLDVGANKGDFSLLFAKLMNE